MYKLLKNSIYIDKENRTFSHIQIEPHYHSYYELFFVTEGSCRLLVYDKAYHLSKGEIMLISPPEHHLSIYDRANVCTRYVLYFNPEAIDEKLINKLPFSYGYLNTTRKLLLNNSAIDELISMAERLLDIFNRQSTVQNNILDNTPDLMIHYIFQTFLLQVFNNSTLGTYDPRQYTIESDLERAARYIAQNFQDDICLTDAAAAAGLTPTYFSKKFKTIIGIGFSEYLTQIRLTHAATLLKSTDLSITAISEACGFSNSNYFGDVFREAFSLSPRAYRHSDGIS